jgi:hypothetical protein
MIWISMMTMKILFRETAAALGSSVMFPFIVGMVYGVIVYPSLAFLLWTVFVIHFRIQMSCNHHNTYIARQSPERVPSQ